MAIMRPPQQALRTERQHDGHDQEGEDHRIGRRVDQPDLLGKPDDQRADRRAGDRAHAAHDHHDEAGEQEARILAGD
jgi:hypothetical protein